MAVTLISTSELSPLALAPLALALSVGASPALRERSAIRGASGGSGNGGGGDGDGGEGGGDGGGDGGGGEGGGGEGASISMMSKTHATVEMLTPSALEREDVVSRSLAGAEGM